MMGLNENFSSRYKLDLDIFILIFVEDVMRLWFIFIYNKIIWTNIMNHFQFLSLKKHFREGKGL